MRKQLSKYAIRLEMLKESYTKLESFKLDLPEVILEGLVYSYDNLENDHKLTATVKESFFTARELIDLVINKLAYEFKGTISNDFSKFIIGLANGKYSHLNSPCIEYLSQPSIIRLFIAIRTIRNKMKKDLDLVFHCVNQKDLKITLQVDLPKKLRNNIINFDEIVDIKNRHLVTDKNLLGKINYQISPNLLNNFIVLFEDIKRECNMK